MGDGRDMPSANSASFERHVVEIISDQSWNAFSCPSEYSRFNCPMQNGLALPALFAYNAYMQYTLRNIPKSLDAAIRQRARAEHKSLNEVAIQALAKALRTTDIPERFRQLGDIAGTWREDPEFDAAIEEQRKIEKKLWK